MATKLILFNQDTKKPAGKDEVVEFLIVDPVSGHVIPKIPWTVGVYSQSLVPITGVDEVSNIYTPHEEIKTPVADELTKKEEDKTDESR